MPPHHDDVGDAGTVAVDQRGEVVGEEARSAEGRLVGGLGLGLGLGSRSGSPSPSPSPYSPTPKGRLRECLVRGSCLRVLQAVEEEVAAVPWWRVRVRVRG
eukprot:scaffold48856_cov25-Phaeocystis_antarctica.AAC.2